MEYRKATPPDIEALANLRIDMLCEKSPLPDNQKLFIRENTKQFFLEGLTDNSVICWVAEHHKSIVCIGCVNFFSLPPNDWCPVGKTAYIGNMYTLPDFRGRGIAFAVLSHLIDESKSRQCQRILLNTTDMGRHLYEKMGFETSSTAMALYPFGIAH